MMAPRLTVKINGRSKIGIIARFLVFFIVIWIVVHSLIITFDGVNDAVFYSDVAIVLGSKVNEDGTPSERLKARLVVAEFLFKKGTIKYIVVSGGMGKENYDEAAVMKLFLEQKGIPASAIIVDNEGNNTYLTATNFINLNKNYHFKSAILISQFFHLSRSKLIFRKVGFSNIGTAHADYFEWRDIYSVLREFPAFYYYLFKEA